MNGLKKNMRTRKLVYNTVSSFLCQIVSIVCGFLLPRFVLVNYGSETNGLLNSITQFLSVIALLEFGVGAVVESALYEPLSKHDTKKISEVIVSANRFFKRLAGVLAGYIVLLIFVFPKLTESELGWFSTAVLVISLGVSSFAQYYFGFVDKILLMADQRGCVYYIIFCGKSDIFGSRKFN